MMTNQVGWLSRGWRLALLPAALALLIMMSVSVARVPRAAAAGPYVPAADQFYYGWPYGYNGYNGYNYGWPYGYSGYNGYNYSYPSYYGNGWPYGYNGYYNYSQPYASNGSYNYGYGYSPYSYGNYYGYSWPYGYGYSGYWPYTYGSYSAWPYSYGTVNVSVTPGTPSPAWIWCTTIGSGGVWEQVGKIPYGVSC